MKNPPGKPAGIVIAVVVFLTILSLLLTVVGNVSFELSDSSLSIHTAFWKDHTVGFEEIEQVSLRNDFEPGSRENGFGSARLNLGDFNNHEFGDYLLYAYAKCSCFVVLKLKDDSVIVLGDKDPASTTSLYEKLSRSCGS